MVILAPPRNAAHDYRDVHKVFNSVRELAAANEWKIDILHPACSKENALEKGVVDEEGNPTTKGFDNVFQLLSRTIGLQLKPSRSTQKRKAPTIAAQHVNPDATTPSSSTMVASVIETPRTRPIHVDKYEAINQQMARIAIESFDMDHHNLKENMVYEARRAIKRISGAVIYPTGSFVTGLGGPQSDLDLCCWMGQPTDDKEETDHLLRRIRGCFKDHPLIQQMEYIKWARVPILDMQWKVTTATMPATVQSDNGYNACNRSRLA